jgi:serine protease Do
MPTTPSHRKAKWLGAVALAALAAGGTAGSFAQTAAPAQTQAPITVQAPQMPSFADVVERVKPAVVSVRVKTRQVADRGGEDGGPGFSGPDLPDGHPLQRFFREFRGGEGQFRDGPRGQRPGPDRRFGRQSQGSGFIVSADGTVVTNNHVVDKSDSVEVVLEDGRTLDAKVIGTDPKTDLAVLKITEEGVFPFVKFAPVTPRVGDWVVAIGNPFGLGGTVTAGIVSARGRDIGSGPYDDYIQIDAPVNRGNSGGPTFNLSGEVVGINTAIFSPSGGNVGIAFAIPSESAQKVVAELKEKGSVQRGFIGVQIQPVTKEVAEAIGLKEARGALVAEAVKGSPAEKAGIKTGDTILAVEGQPIREARDLSRRIAAYAPGRTVQVTVYRDGQERQVSLEIAKQSGA